MIEAIRKAHDLERFKESVIYKTMDTVSYLCAHMANGGSKDDDEVKPTKECLCSYAKDLVKMHKDERFQDSGAYDLVIMAYWLITTLYPEFWDLMPD